MNHCPQCDTHEIDEALFDEGICSACGSHIDV